MLMFIPTKKGEKDKETVEWCLYMNKSIVDWMIYELYKSEYESFRNQMNSECGDI